MMFNPNYVPNLLFHLTVVCIGIATISWVKALFPDTYRLYFLTNWSLAVQTFSSFSFAIKDILRIVGVIEPNEFDAKATEKKKASKWTQIHFALFHLSIVMPIMVVAMFWIIYYLDRKYLGPAGLDNFPSALNHLLHTSPGVVAALEVLLYIMVDSKGIYSSRDGHTAARKIGTLAAVLIIVAYGLMIITVNQHTGSWPYPFLGKFTVVQFIIFSLCVIMTFALTSRFVNSVCSCICNSVHGTKPSQKSS